MPSPVQADDSGEPWPARADPRAGPAGAASCDSDPVPEPSVVPNSCRMIRTVTVATATASAIIAIWSLRRRRLCADLEEECTPEP